MSQSAGIQVLYSDDALLVINKPAGLSTLPDGYDPTLPHVKRVLEQQAGRLWIVHRLDKDTSGVLLLARTASAHRSLNTQFEQHTVSKVYHALVNGSPGWEQKTIDLPLRPNGDRHHRTVIDPQVGKPAVTHVSILERWDQFCLVEAIPETGRTHQVRAHLSAVDLYILGDALYGGGKRALSSYMETGQLAEKNLGKVSITGMGLHARSLAITHPDSGQRCKFEAPYPAWWDETLAVLRTSS